MKITITYIEYLNNSIYGNPRQKVWFYDENNKTQVATTKSNATIGYIIDNYVGKTIDIDWHYTKTGNIILDRIK